MTLIDTFSYSQANKTALYSTNQGVVVVPPQVETEPVLASYSIDADGNLTPSAAIYATSDNVGTFGSGVWVGANPAPPFEVHLVSSDLSLPAIRAFGFL